MIMGGKGMDSGNWKSKRSSYLQMIHHNFPICFFSFQVVSGKQKACKSEAGGEIKGYSQLYQFQSS